ncbi:NAD(P)-dependent oxidoreductase [Streptomyces sp. NPDC006140]|uniref:NAD(P)-dependent oxidoreductase n=1 Tax=Streptomyces sp. NPDC006140 TaxID=3154579 RepID=UPI0033D9C99B
MWKDDLASSFFDLYSQTLTIVGCGSVGVRVAEVAQAFGMHVIGVRRRPPSLRTRRDRVGAGRSCS